MGTKTRLADAGFLVALLDERDRHHAWAAKQGASTAPPPWLTCEAALSEAFFLLGRDGGPVLMELMRRGAVSASFALDQHQTSVLALMSKYADVPMSLADACIVRMTETHRDSVVLTTDRDFAIYRRHGRQVVPCVTPY